MKTISLLTVYITVFLLSVSFNSNAFSSGPGMDCGNCGGRCKEAMCCIIESEKTSQSNSGCCTGKCANEGCKKCCESGDGTMLMKIHESSSGNQGTSGNMNVSCCSDKNDPETKSKDCCN